MSREKMLARAEVEEIVVLDHGKVIERGRYDQLIESGGAFTRLWRQGRPDAPDAPDAERSPV